jgi:hypothetical protein
MTDYQSPEYDPRQHEQRVYGTTPPPAPDRSWARGPQPPQPPYGAPPQGPAYAPQWQPPHGRRGKSWPRRHPFLSVLGCFAFLIVVSVIASAGSRTGTTPAPATGGVAAAATATAQAAAVKPHTVATFSGSGEDNTGRFTVASTWKLDYSFNCSSFGSAGNFIVYEDGGSDLNGVDVDEMATTKTASSWAYNDAGTHYLEIDSECDWTVTVIDEG